MDELLFETQLTTAEIQSSIGVVLDSPKDAGILELIVRRPKVNSAK